MEELNVEGIEITTAFLIGFGLVFLVLIGFYILNAIAVSRIAKNNGYDKHWLAWIPIANAFVIPILINNDKLVNQRIRGRFVTIFAVVYILSVLFADSLAFSLVLMFLTYYSFYIVVKWYSHNHVAHLIISIFTLGMSMPFSLIRFRNREKLTSEFEEKDSTYI